MLIHGVLNDVLNCHVNFHDVSNNVMVCDVMNDGLNHVVWNRVLIHGVVNDVLDYVNFHDVANDAKVCDVMVYDAMNDVLNHVV